MESAHRRINRLIEAGLVSVQRKGLKCVPEFKHVSGRVRFAPWVGGDGVQAAGKFAQVIVDGVAAPVSYCLNARQSSSSSVEAGYEHFMSLCRSLGLLGSEFSTLAKEPNNHASAGVAIRWSKERLLGFAVENASVDDAHSVASFVPNADRCSYQEAFDITRLISSDVLPSRAEAASWLAEQIRDAFADGEDARGYAYVDLMGRAVELPIVVCVGKGGRVELWDGWHRVAASLCRGAMCIRAVVVDETTKAEDRDVAYVKADLSEVEARLN